MASYLGGQRVAAVEPAAVAGVAVTAHRRELTVRFHEVDSEGVVFNAWYLTWLHDTVLGLLASAGHDRRVLTDAGLTLRVVHAELDFAAGLRLDDRVTVTVAPSRVGRTSFALAATIARGDVVAARATLVYVVVAADGTGSRALPPALRSAFEAIAE